MIERCSECGANLAMVGRSHRCIPNSGRVEAVKPAVRQEGGVDRLPRPVSSSDGGSARAKRTKQPTMVSRLSPPGSSEPKPKFRKPLAKDAGKTLMATKPWAAEGISRRTWYRRKKDGKS